MVGFGGIIVSNLGGLVLAGSDEVRAISGPLEIMNGLVQLMNRYIVEELASLCVVLADAAVFVSRDNVLVQVAEASNGSLALVADNGEVALLGLGCFGIRVDLVNDDIGEITHSLLGNAEQLGAVFTELDALDGGGELPSLEAPARLDVPETNGVIGRAGGD